MSDLDTSKKSGSLDYTLATFVYLLHDEGHSCTDQTIEQACVSIKEAANKAHSQRVAQKIADVLSQSFGESPANSTIESFIESNYSQAQYTSTSPQILASELVSALGSSLQNDTNLKSWMSNHYTDASLLFTFSGETRNEKISSIRKHLFVTSRPWLAKIASRTGSEIGHQWILVEDFSDSVTCMDPYPWDDIDEEYTMSIEEFMVRWELAGEEAVALQD